MLEFIISNVFVIFYEYKPVVHGTDTYKKRLGNGSKIVFLSCE